MDSIKRCPRCGAELRPGAAEELCPKCLLNAGLEAGLESRSTSQPAATSAYGARFVPPDPAELGKLFPQLEIISLLGQGGMGAVYKARQPGLDRLVALKILPREVAQDSAFSERFTREARALARLNHPHIVTVFEFGQAGDLYYLVMEYVDGVNLRQMIHAGGMQTKDALAIVPQICEALQFAHDEGIVHRDIKPENILIDRRGRVKIADFGLAKLLGHEQGDHNLTATNQVMGTVRYMAPEQMEGSREVDHRADIYSLGVVFYELLTGELPLGRFAPPSKKVHIDVRLDEVVLHTLEKEPDRRYQHASQIKTDVESIQQSTFVPADVGERAATPLADRVLLRRLTIFSLILITLAEAMFIALQWGYLRGAEWYFKQELPYTQLSTWCVILSVWSAATLGWWWYLLAKAPNVPRNFSGFFRVVQTPDSRIKWLWLPLGLFFGAWVASVFVAFAAFGDTAQTLTFSSGFVVGPYVLMAALWFVYRRPAPLGPALSLPVNSPNLGVPAAASSSVVPTEQQIAELGAKGTVPLVVVRFFEGFWAWKCFLASSVAAIMCVLIWSKSRSSPNNIWILSDEAISGFFLVAVVFAAMLWVIAKTATPAAASSGKRRRFVHIAAGLALLILALPPVEKLPLVETTIWYRSTFTYSVPREVMVRIPPEQTSAPPDAQPGPYQEPEFEYVSARLVRLNSGLADLETDQPIPPRDYNNWGLMVTVAPDRLLYLRPYMPELARRSTTGAYLTQCSFSIWNDDVAPGLHPRQPDREAAEVVSMALFVLVLLFLHRIWRPTRRMLGLADPVGSDPATIQV